MYKTIDEAVQAIEATLNNRKAREWRSHGYVYALNGEFGTMFHNEDKYLFSFIPFGAKLKLHATFVGYEPDETVTWEQRGTHSQEDVDVLLSHGEIGAALVLLGIASDNEDE